MSNEVGEARRLYQVTVHGELGAEAEEEARIGQPPPLLVLSPAGTGLGALKPSRAAWATSSWRPSLILPHPH